MDPYEIAKHWRAKPFRPFRMVRKDGKAFDITDPAMLGLSMVSVHVLRFGEGQTPGIDLAEDITSFPPQSVIGIEEIAIRKAS